MNPKPFTLDRVVRMLIGLTVLVFLFLLLQRLSGVLLPFLVAWLLAYLLQPIVRFFQIKLRFKNRALSVLATLLFFFGTFTAIICLLFPIVSSEIYKLSGLISTYSKNLNVNSLVPIAWQQEIQRYVSHLNFQTILKDENIMNGLKKLAPQLWDFVNGSLDFVLGFSVVIIIFLYMVFILMDYEKIAVSMLGVIPPRYRKLTSEIIHDMENGMNRYFRGQALIALIVGVLFVIGFSIIGLPLAIVMGLLIAVFTLVPYLKAMALIPSLILGLMQSVETGQSYGSVVLGIAIVFIVVQLIEDLFLTPRIMGKVTGMNPAVILLSLSVWGSLMGMVGLIIALPVTTLIISYYSRFVLHFDTSEKEILPEEVEK